MSKQELTTLLKRYFSDEITPDEKLELAHLISANTTADALQSSVEELWNDYQPEEQLLQQESEDQLKRILEKINQQNKEQRPAVVRQLPFWKKWKYQTVAAAAVVAIIAGVIYFNSTGTSVSTKDNGQLAVATPRITKNIVLPDSSLVILQPGSRLDYAPVFGKDARELTLTGEAWFDVRHDATRPFIVHTGKVSTTVLGTAFSVRAWENGNDVVVTVNRGRVQVADNAGVLGVITPDQQISYNNATAIASQSSVNAAEISSWKEQEYTMDDLTIEEMTRALQEKYGVAIEVTQKEGTGECRFTGSFRQDETLDRVLNVISKVFKASWIRKDNKILLQHIRCDG